MSIWERYSEEQRNAYIKFLTVYGALTNLFRQKQGDLIPYLDSKFQETVFAKVFNGQLADYGNTPHDVVSVFGDERIGIGLKTWMSSTPSYQKVMQLKRHQSEISEILLSKKKEELVLKISEIKNDKMRRDYERLGLTENKNIYHYVTRDQGLFHIMECSYPLISLDKLKNIELTETSVTWSDDQKNYKYTFADSQIYQKFDGTRKDTSLLNTFDIKIIEDPFSFLLNAYFAFIENTKFAKNEIIEVYLPLYSFRTKDVEKKSGLNAWNSAPKSKNSSTLRPLDEVYIPIPREFHKKHPDFFTKDIFKAEREIQNYNGDKANKPEIRFHLILPNGKKIPALITQERIKGLQSGSMTEFDENGKRFGQSALGKWLLVDVLGLKERQVVTRDWLQKKGTDSIRLWRKKNDYSTFNIDFAPIDSFEAFMNDKPIPQDDE